MPFYKFLLRFVQISVILIVLPRVASFLALLGGEEGFEVHDVIRFAFAAALGLGVMATAYFSEHLDPPEYEDEPTNPKERKRREREAVYFASMNNAAKIAGRTLMVFALLDGAFNLADALYGASQTGIIDPVKQGDFLAVVYGIVTVVFGISPTVLSIVLSRLISAVDRIPKGFEKTPTAGQVDLVQTIASNMGVRLISKSEAAHLLRPEDRTAERTIEQLPEPIEQSPVRSFDRSNDRTDRTDNPPVRSSSNRSIAQTVDQKARVMQYLDTFGDAQPIRTIRDSMEDPKPSPSTIANALTEWRMQRQLQ